jgi:hypothetical protein
MIKNVNPKFFICGIYINVNFKLRGYIILNFPQILRLAVLSGGFMSFFNDRLSEEDIVETKKCKYCLRRVKLDWYKCPYCGKIGFHFNEN